MIDEQALREFANTLISEPVSRSISEIEAAGEFIKVLLDELATLREAVKQARIDALDEARKHCDELAGFLSGHQDRMGASLIVSVRDSIDAMKETP